MSELDLSTLTGVVVYSAVTTGYDVILPPLQVDPSYQYVLFADESVRSPGWKHAPLVKTFDSPVLTNRYHKFFPHRLMPDTEFSIYVDGNIGIIGDVSKLMREFIESRAAIGLFRHRDRVTIDEEVEACIEMGKYDPLDLPKARHQLQYILQSGMPPAQQLTDNAVIFRWHKHPKHDDAMEEWWGHINTFTKRDQISLPYVIWEKAIPAKRWDWSFREENRFFQHYRHQQSHFHGARVRLRHTMYRNKFMRSLYSVIDRAAKRLRSARAA